MVDEKMLINAIRDKRDELEADKKNCETVSGFVDVLLEIFDRFIDFVKDQPKVGEYRLAEDPPKDDNYILLSFANFSIPLVGRYEEWDEGGAYYIGDDDKPCTASGLFVDAWMPLPDPYRVADDITRNHTNADRIRSMTDEELANIILCPYDTAGSPASIMPCVKDGVQQLVAPDDCHKCMMS